jgi:hypothetical protein
MNNIQKSELVIKIGVCIDINQEPQNKDNRLESADNVLSELQAGLGEAFDQNNQLWIDCLIQKALDIVRDSDVVGSIQ